MATTLTYGLIKPTDGDLGSTWFDNLEANITQLDAHTHNGTNSPRLTSKSVTKETDAIASGSWGSLIGGVYSQTVTMPSGMLFADFGLEFRIDSTEEVIHPTVVQASTTSYTVSVNDNTLNLIVMYL